MRNLQRLLTLTFLLFLPLSSAFAASAYVHDLRGTLTAQRGSEPARSLAMGDTFDAGVTLSTAANSIAVLKFEDGQVVTLSPNTRFAVREYRYNLKAVKESSIVFQLVQGGLRFVTGVIGATNRNAFRMNVGTATIGVRGTDGFASYIEGVILAAVNQGALEFTTPAGTQTIPVASTALVDTAGRISGTLVAPTSQIRDAVRANAVVQAITASADTVRTQINNVQIPINTPAVIAASAQAAQVVATARAAQALAAAAANNAAAAKTAAEQTAAAAALQAANLAAAQATALATAAIATAQQAAVQAFNAAVTAGYTPPPAPPPTPTATPLTAIVPSLTTAQIQAQTTLISTSVVTQTTNLQTTQTTLNLPVTPTSTIQDAQPLVPPTTPPAAGQPIQIFIPPPPVSPS